MTRTILFAVIAGLTTAPVVFAQTHEDVLRAEADRIETIAEASAAVIAVMGGEGGGSGVVISPDGYALSNFHVTQAAGVALKCGMPDGKLYDAVIVGIDPTGDVALIKLFGRDDFPHATMGDSDLMRVGDWAMVIGNPFLLANDFQPTVSYGIISGVHRYQYPAGTLLEYADCLQTDAAINPGNSGGPLFNAQGELIGINGRGSFEKRGRVNVGVGYAISINQIKHFLGYLKSGRIVDHATLGATVATDEDGYVVVDEILEESDAYRRGLRYDDTIVRFAGRDIRTVNAFKNVLGIFPRGWRVPLTYRRDGKTYDRIVRLEGVHHEGELAAIVRGPRKKLPTPEGEEDPDRPKIPRIPMLAPPQQEPELPEVVSQHFEARSGYANYYFNLKNQDRIRQAYSSRGDYFGAGSTLFIEGSLDDGSPVTIELTEEMGTIVLPEGESKSFLDDDLTGAIRPLGTGGLIAALHIWKRFMTVAPDAFGDIYYLGTAPAQAGQGMVDVLVGTYGGVETRFYFDPAEGDLVGLNMFADDDVDPCEIYFSDIRQVSGRAFPRRIEIRHASETYAVITVTNFEFREPVEE